MKRLTTCLSVLLIAFMFITTSANAQQKNSIIIKEKESFFVDKSTETSPQTMCEFILKGLSETANTKGMTSKALDLKGVTKIGISNITTDNHDERECFVIFDNENYLNVFPQVMSVLSVNKVLINGKEESVQSFVESMSK